MKIINKSMDIDISQVVEWQDNPRSIKDADLKRLQKQIAKHGQYKPLLCIKENNTYVVIGGNMRRRALEALGVKKVWITEISVKDEREKVEISLSDNDRVGFYMQDELAFQIKDLNLDLEAYKVDLKVPDIDLSAILDRAQAMSDADNEAPALPETSSIKPGDIFTFKDHRVMCGDCGIKENMDRLMDGKLSDVVFTDPPYGVDYGSKLRMLQEHGAYSGKKIKDIAGDAMQSDDLSKMLVQCFTLLREHSAEHCSYYVTAPQDGKIGLMMIMMMMSGLEVRHILNWVKSSATFSLGRLDYEYKHEPIFYTWTKKHYFYGNGQQKTSCWEIPRPKENKLHPTMKPVELVVNAILNSSQKGDIVTDIFLGSGSTLIAAEKTGRKCYGMELDPRYIEVIIKRWEDMAGEKAVKL